MKGLVGLFIVNTGRYSWPMTALNTLKSRHAALSGLVALLALIALPVAGQDSAPDKAETKEAPLVSGADLVAGMTDIPVEEWRSLAMGKTLVYQVGPDLFALERYPLTGNRVELQLNTGECYSGVWNHQGQAYCFYWDADQPACFRHMRRGDEIVIVELQDGAPTDRTQTMTQITNASLACGQHMS